MKVYKKEKNQDRDYFKPQPVICTNCAENISYYSLFIFLLNLLASDDFLLFLSLVLRCTDGYFESVSQENAMLMKLLANRK